MDGQEGLAVGDGFDILLDSEAREILQRARLHSDPVSIRPSWVRVRGTIAGIVRRDDGALGLSLNRLWPQAGAIVVWASPHVERRIVFPPTFLVGLGVEAVGVPYTRDRGATLELDLTSPDQIAFLYTPNPDLPAPTGPRPPVDVSHPKAPHETSPDDQTPPEAHIT